MRIFYGAEPGQISPQVPPPGQAGEVELQIVKTLHISRQPLYDGPTRTALQWDVEVIAQINPQATAYALAAVGADPAVAFGTVAANTDKAIRDRLMTPQRQLHLYIGNTLLVSCPGPGFDCDPMYGPKPYRADILNNTGDKTLAFRFGIRFWTNPCESVAKETAVLLSHRWRQARVLDGDGFAQITTSGHAIFDAAKLQLFQAVPDDFFDEMVRPLEKGFRRDSINVVAHEDATQLQYEIVDRQTPVSIAESYALKCSRIECHFTTNISREGFFEGAERGFEKGAQIGRNLFGSGGDALGIETAAQAAGAIGIAMAGAAIGGFRGTVPTQTYSGFVRVWGHRESKKKELELIGRKIIETLLFNYGFRGLFSKVPGFDISVTRDVMGRWVQVSAMWRSPPVRQLFEVIKNVGAEAFGDADGKFNPVKLLPLLNFGLVGGVAFNEVNKRLFRSRGKGVKGGVGPDGEIPSGYVFSWPETPDHDDVIAPGNDQIILSKRLQHPGIPGHVEGSEYSRGDWLGRIVAQILTITCQSPPKPPGNAEVVSRRKETGGTDA